MGRYSDYEESSSHTWREDRSGILNEIIPFHLLDTTVPDPHAMIAAWSSAGAELAGFKPGCRLAKISHQVFLLRAYAGLSTDQSPNREGKDKYSQMAYVLSALNFIRNVLDAHYQTTIDGEVIQGDVLFILIFIIGSIGSVMGMKLRSVGDGEIRVGFLDIYSSLKG